MGDMACSSSPYPPGEDVVNDANMAAPGTGAVAAFANWEDETLEMEDCEDTDG